MPSNSFICVLATILLISTVTFAEASSSNNKDSTFRKLLSARKSSSHDVARRLPGVPTFRMGGQWMNHATWALKALTCDSNPSNANIKTGKSNCGFWFADYYNMGDPACVLAPLDATCNYCYCSYCCYHSYTAGACETKFNNRKYVGFDFDLGSSVSVGYWAIKTAAPGVGSMGTQGGSLYDENGNEITRSAFSGVPDSTGLNTSPPMSPPLVTDKLSVRLIVFQGEGQNGRADQRYQQGTGE